MAMSRSTTQAVVTAPISIAVLLFGGALWAALFRTLGADLSNHAWDVAVFPLWFLTACGWGLLLRTLDRVWPP